MMDVSSVGFEERDDLYKSFDPEPKAWEKIAREAYTIFSTIALGAFITTFGKKKRVYSLDLPGHPPQVIEIAEEPVVERPPEQLAPQRADRPAHICADVERDKVRALFKTIAESNWAGLAWNAVELRRIGKEIEHIHPFSFLFSPEKEHVRQIFREGDRLKIYNVMGGITKGMEREYAKNNLVPHIPIFEAAFVEDPQNTKNHPQIQNQMKDLITVRNWRGLVDYLFNVG